MTDQSRRWRLIIVSAAVFAIVAWSGKAVQCTPLLSWCGDPGFTLTWSGFSNPLVADVERNGPAAIAGLKQGDVIVTRALGIADLWGLIEVSDGEPVPTTAPLTYVVDRGNIRHTIAILPTPQPTWGTWYRWTLLVALLWMPLLAIFIARRSDLVEARILAFFLITLSLALTLQFNALRFPDVSFGAMLLDIVIATAPIALFAKLAAQFGQPISPTRRLLTILTYSTCCVSAVLFGSLWVVPPLSIYNLFPPLRYALALASLFATCGGIAAIGASSGIDRQRIAWATASIGVFWFYESAISWLLPTVSFANVIFSQAGPFMHLLMTVGLTYAILSRRLLNVDYVLNRTIVLTMIATVLAAAFMFLDWLYTNYVTQTHWQIAMGAAVAFGLGWAASASRGQLIALVDRLFFQKRHLVMRQLYDLQRRLETEGPTGGIGRTVVDGVAETLKLSSAALFLKMPDGGFMREAAFGWNPGSARHLLADDAIVEGLAGRDSRPTRVDNDDLIDIRVPGGPARPIVAIPLGSFQTGFALYGAHEDGRDIDPDETHGLAGLCSIARAHRR